MNSPEILFVVPCDLIRQETSGKFLAVGIYSEGVALSQMPGSLSLSFLFWMNLNQAGVYNVDLEAHWHGDDEIIQKFGFKFEIITNSERTCMPLGPVVFPTLKDGTLVVREVNLNIDVLRLRVTGPSAVDPAHFSFEAFSSTNSKI